MTNAPTLPAYPGDLPYTALVADLRAAGHSDLLSFLAAWRHQPVRVLDGLWRQTAPARWSPIDGAYLRLVREHFSHASPAFPASADARRAAGTVLDVLDTVAARDRMALWRVVLFQVSRFLFRRLAAGFPARGLIQAVTDLGVDPGEAGLLAFAVAEGYPAPSDETALQFAEAISRRALRRAETLSAELRHVDDPALRTALEELRATLGRVDTLAAEAASWESRGDSEQAVGRYLAAAELVIDDPAVDLGIRRCPPPPVPAVDVVVNDLTATVRWLPSPARVGTIAYRLDRVSHAGRRALDDGPDGPAVVLAELTGKREFADQPPVGTEVRYRVYTVRTVQNGIAMSAPTLSAPAAVAPDVTAVRQDVALGAIELRWRPPPLARGVIVLRATAAPPAREAGNATLLRPVGDGFLHDANVEKGTVYFYRVIAVYGDEDAPVHSTGVVTSVAYDDPPAPIDRVEVEASPGDHAILVSWPRPARGHVRVFRSAQPPPPVGAAGPVSVTELHRLGELIPEPPRTAHGRETLLTAPAAHGPTFYTVVSILGVRAWVGPTLVARVASPVTDLTVRRFGHEARLRWTWPPEAGEAHVWWRSHDGSGTRTVTQGDYLHTGCVRITVPAGPVSFGVSLMGGSSQRHADVVLEVPATAALPAAEGSDGEVRYEIVRQLRPYRRRLRLTAQRHSGRLPDFVLIARSGTVRPLRREPGDHVVLRLSPLELPPGQAAEHEFDVRALPRPCYLRGFFDQAETSRIRLVDPPARQLLVG
jgi:hypothetical protein